MEDPDSGALDLSDTSTEVETWVKLSNFPVECLTAETISFIVSSFGSPVGADEDTFEKVENQKLPPKLRRKLHSRKTFVTICVRVSVTKPLPSLVAFGSTEGREYIIRLDFDPTPKVCLLCLGAGHFDFECCGTDKESVEIIAEAGGGFDGFCADFHGEQGAVSTYGLHSYEDATVVEAALMVDSHILPAASCETGPAAAPELMPLLPAFDHEIKGTLITEGSETFEEPPVLNVDPLLPPHAPGIFGAAATDLAEDLHHIEQVVSVVYCPKKHQKWRDKLDVQGLLYYSYGLGSFGFDEDPSGVCMEAAAVLPFSVSRAVQCVVSATSPLKGMADPYIIDVQVPSGINRHIKHHLWCDLLDEQGLFSDEDLDMLQLLFRLVWFLIATHHDQLIFQIHHKWRDKGMLI